MSLVPVKDNDPEDANRSDEERKYLLGAALAPRYHAAPPGYVEDENRKVAELILKLFTEEHDYSHQHPQSSPRLPPVPRFRRHRNFYIYLLNEFRHWWKTSRLLVRLAGATVWCQDPLHWRTMAILNVNKARKAHQGLKMVKVIGRGGPIKMFLDEVQPFTRTLRIILGAARAWEARVDNRLYEVGLAEALAFMGNRCFRQWGRSLAMWLTKWVAFPISGAFMAPYLDQRSRPVIIFMGFLKAILPFAGSFQGARLGRQMTFNTYNYANYRWKPVMNIMHFHELAGVYQDTDLDPDLLAHARAVATAIAHWKDFGQTREKLIGIGYVSFGSGSGGYATYRKQEGDTMILLHLTPYGPSVSDEMPMFLLIERRRLFHRTKDQADAIILDAASKYEAKVVGYTYSGAFFQSQEWAALKTRYNDVLRAYAEACRTMGTDILPPNKRNPQCTKTPTPPMDLVSLKAFLRNGNSFWKQRRDKSDWGRIEGQIKKMSKLLARYQAQGKAPKRVILYLEGLDCAGKSSTGMLICDALRDCGYSVDIAQHNTPPTAEQKKKAWMDRGRFQYPDDMFEAGSPVPEYASIVWDRGPAGDFVYGKLDELPTHEKVHLYQQFRDYDYKCRNDGALFCKVFFVSDKDSIARTLGKRLAHKKITKDLITWLGANHSEEEFAEGIKAIEMHIDPTDFVAFNHYEENLLKFSEVVRNTNSGAPPGCTDLNERLYYNPWLVVSTSDRTAARINILKAFQVQLQRFSRSPDDRMNKLDRLKAFLFRDLVDYPVDEPIPSNIVEIREHGISLRAVIQCFFMLMLVGAYLHLTWKVELDDVF